MSKRLLALATAVLAVGLGSQAFAQTSLTFQVNMGVQMQLNTFDPAKNVMVIRGDFEHYVAVADTDWKGNQFFMAKSKSNDSVYTLTVDFPATMTQDTIHFQFCIIDTSSGQMSLTDSSTQGGTWETPGNRTYIFTSDPNQQTPLVYWSDVSVVGVTVNITFQADMTDLLAAGFDPSADSIGVMGPFPPTNWGTQVTMSPVFGTPTTYAVTIPLNYKVGDTVQYKFHAMGRDLFTNGGWENSGSGAGWNAGNRIFVFPGVDSTLDAYKPNLNITAATTVADTVTFTVNMNGAVETYHNTPITGLTGVYIGGADAPLKWPSDWVMADTTSGTGSLIPLYDDGNLALHGDSTAGDGKWSAIIVFPTQSVAALQYKFGAVFPGVDTLNGGQRVLDNEAGNSINHTVVLTGTHQYVYNKFGDQVTAVRENPNAVKVPTKYDLSQNYPNPFNPTTQINFSVPKNSFVTLKVYNVLGQEVATLFSGMQKAGNYVATFDANRFASGVYFYRLQAGNFSSVKKMMLLK